jgi:RimJ/RimL family protein N-acetyltransferase
MTFRVETERLILDLLRPGDEHRAIGWTGDPVATRYMAWKRHESLDSAREFVNRASSPVLEGRPLLDFVIAIRLKDENLLLGTTGVHQRDTNVVETGYILHPDHWRQGYGAEALRGVIGWVFGNMPPVNEVIAPVFAENVASQGLAQKVGMTLVREERKDMPRGDKDVRILVFSISRETWRSQELP